MATYTVRILSDEHQYYTVSAASPEAAVVSAKRRATEELFDDVGGDGRGVYQVVVGRVANGGLGFDDAIVLSVRAHEVQS